MITIRPATLDDVPAITAIHCADIVTWRRWDADGSVHLASYADLSPYERWLNGGPWMDVTTCRPHLAALLASGGLALVAERDGQVRAVAEAVQGEEPPPFGRHLNLSVLYTLRGHAGQGLGSALMAALLAAARAAGCDNLLVSHAAATGFYAKHGLAPLQTWRRAALDARAGHTRYTAEPFTDLGYEAVRGWAMPIGRYQSARQEWERMRPGAQPDFIERRGHRLERWRLVVRHTPAWLVLEAVPRAPGTAESYLWLPPGQDLTRQHVAALRDRAARSGYAVVSCFMAEAALPRLGHGWRDDGYRQAVWLKPLRGIEDPPQSPETKGDRE